MLIQDMLQYDIQVFIQIVFMIPNPRQYVQYARVSTKIQDYGIEVQKRKMDEYISKEGGTSIGIFIEKESGKRCDRRELRQAIDLSKSQKAILLVSKLDRLSRDISFIFDLKNSGIEFIVAENPDLNTLTLGIFAVMAQHERELICERVKAGMAVAKEAGKIAGRKEGYKRPKEITKKIIKTRNRKIEDKKEEIIKFATEHGKFIDGSLIKLVEMMKAGRFKNSRGNPYSVRNLKGLGINLKKRRR